MSAALLRVLLESSLRSLVVTVVVMTLLHVFRIQASRMRHAALTGLLGTMMLMPVLPALFDAMGTQIHLQEMLPSRAMEIIDRSAKVPAFTFVEQTKTTPPSASDGRGASQSLSPIQAAPQQPLSVLNAPETRTVDGMSLPGVSRVPFYASVFSLANWTNGVVAVYLLVVVSLLVRLLLGWRTSLHLVRRSTPIVDERLAALMARHQVYESRCVAAPVTIGLLGPRIILPMEWSLWPEAKRNAVLTHELGHVRRRDPLILMMSGVNCCVFWLHPLAWWLDNALVRTGEYASDDAVMVKAEDHNAYVEVLLDMARAARERGGRVAFNGIGMADGLVTERIERILRGDFIRQTSLIRAATLALSGLIVVGAIAACRYQPSIANWELTAEEERQERELEATLRALSGPLDGFPLQAANQSSEPTDAIEARVKQNPDNLDDLQSLLLYYWRRLAIPRGIDRNGTVVYSLTPNEQRQMQLARRGLVLWLIEHHPESALAGSPIGAFFPENFRERFPGDPEGLAQARPLWEKVVARANVTSVELGNAAKFFEVIDPSLSERLLLRAQTLDPSLIWSVKLGRLYAGALVGWPDLVMFRNLDPNSPSAGTFSQSGYGALVRRKLGESNDEALLTATAWFIRRTPLRGRSSSSTWSQDCLNRALTINPSALVAHTMLVEVRKNEEFGHSVNALWTPPLAKRYDSVVALPEDERFEQLMKLARKAYNDAVSDTRWNDQNLREAIDIQRTQAKQSSEDILRLAPKHRNHPAYGTAVLVANLTLGSLALDSGDKKAALDYLRKASQAPASEEIVYGSRVVWGYQAHLPGDLLKAGERDAVADYLERMSRISLADRAELRDAAATIRRGETPRVLSSDRVM